MHVFGSSIHASVCACLRAGLQRDLCIGNTLAECLEDSLDGSPLGWQTRMDDVSASRRFIMGKVQAIGSSSRAERVAAAYVEASLMNTGVSDSDWINRSGRSSGHCPSYAAAAENAGVFDISLRPASLEALDADTLPVSIPTFVPMLSSMQHIYVGRLHAVNTSVPLSALATAARINPEKAGCSPNACAISCPRFPVPICVLGTVKLTCRDPDVHFHPRCMTNVVGA